MRNDQSNDDVLLESYRRYLLGELDEEEAKDFELRLLKEPDLPVEALDDDLMAACIREEMPPEEKQRILSQLAASPAGRDRLALVQDLTTLAEETETRPQTNVHPFPPRPSQSQRPPYFRIAAIAATLLLAVVGITSWPPVEPPPAVFSLSLFTVRGNNEIPQLKVSSETERVEIRVDVAGEEYPSYNLVLTDVVSGTEVAKQNGVLPQILKEGEVLSFELQAASLPDGEYQLDVYGTEANGPPELVGAPEFAVLQTD